MDEMQSRPMERPAVLTLVGIVLYIWAALAAAEAIALFFNRNDDAWLAVYGDSDAVLVLALTSAVIAVLMFAVGSGIMAGAGWARIAVAIVVGLRLVTLFWYMLTHLGDNAFTWGTLISLGLGLFVLWALYGKDEAVAYFDGFF
jgi:hypothetical protein